MTADEVQEALESATTEQLIAELVSRPTWQGLVIGSEYKKNQSQPKRTFKFRFSHNNLDRDRAIGMLSQAAEKLRYTT